MGILGDAGQVFRNFVFLINKVLAFGVANLGLKGNNLHVVAAAEKMRLPNILPFYSQNGSIAELQHGLNFGSAEATILKPWSQSHQSLNQQLRQVFEIIQLLQLQLGQNSADHFIKSSVVYLSFSKDDYIDLFLGNSSGVMLNYNSQEFAHILVNQMIHVIRILYNANFRKIICTGILPLGCTPRTVWKWYTTSTVEKDGRGCVKEINDIVLEYNTMLNEHIVKLNSKLSDVQIVFCDVYQGIMEIITKPENYGMNLKVFTIFYLTLFL